MDLDSFDLIVFTKESLLGNLISLFQYTIYDNNDQQDNEFLWSHCALILKKDILDLLNIEYNPNEVYLIESTASGVGIDTVFDVNSNAKFGIQIRSLNKLMKEYPDSLVGVYKLKNKINLTDELKNDIKNYYLKIKNYGYTNNFNVFLKNMIPVYFHHFIQDDRTKCSNRFFCSQFCVEFYKVLNLINKETESELMFPLKFIKNFKHLFSEFLYIKLK